MPVTRLKRKPIARNSVSAAAVTVSPATDSIRPRPPSFEGHDARISRRTISVSPVSYVNVCVCVCVAAEPFLCRLFHM